MKKRILAILLSLAALSSLATLFAGAVPYAPPATAMKEFGQQHIYFYEMEDGHAAPREDGLVTEDDGYGDPVATYGMRYITTAEKVVMKEDGLTPRDEYRLVDAGDRSGEYNVFPTADSPQEVWDSITGIETDSPYAFPYAKWYTPTTFSATATYYFYNPDTQTFTTARFVTQENFENYTAITSTTVKYHLRDWALLTEKPADWETGFRNYFFTTGGTYSAVSKRTQLSSSVAPEFEAGKYYTSATAASAVATEPDKWEFDWKNYYQDRASAPVWYEGYYYQKNGDSYVMTLAKPADWDTNYNAYYSLSEVQWFPVTGEVAPEFESGVYYSGTAFQDPTYVIRDPRILTTKPSDWDTKWKNYYYKPSSTGTTYYNLSSKTAPEFESGVYYTGSKLKSKLFLSGEGSTGGLPSLAVLKANQVVLPEKMNLYLRYDNKYLYYAIEITEMGHKRSRYDLNVRYSSTITSSIGISNNNYSFGCFYRRDLNGSAPTVVRDTTGTRTAFHSNVNLSTDGYQMVLNKYGNPNATAITDVLKPGSWFNIKHYTKAQMDSILGVEAPAQTEETDSGELDFESEGDTQSAAAEEEDRDAYKRSDTYGTTVYEYKQLWSVINDKYNGSGSAVPDVFAAFHEINLDNTLGSGAFMIALELPRDTRHLNGSLSRPSSGNWPIETYAMRYVSHTGLTKGENFGQVRFQWASISSGYNPFTMDYILTDYDGVSQKKTLAAAHILPYLFPSGQQPDSKYVTPKLGGTQIRTDSTDEQAMRFLINIPKTEEEIREAGVLVVPTEPACNKQLTLDTKEIRYNNATFATFYGFDLSTRRFVNLTTDVDTYFAANATPADADSFYTADRVGGLPSAIYKVNDLKLDLTTPYSESNKYDTYTVEFEGLKDEDGTYNDWFTFYTIRPYIVYEDGTVIYGEHSYRSVYYVMCWTIQDLVTSYNTSMSLTGTGNRYTMEEMARTAMTYADGTTVTERGETVYTDAENTASTQSPYFGSVNFSLYEPTGEARLEVFRAYAVSLFNRANKGSSLRVKEYDNFTDEQKEIINGYVERFESIWQNILRCESKIYYKEK